MIMLAQLLVAAVITFFVVAVAVVTVDYFRWSAEYDEMERNRAAREAK